MNILPGIPPRRCKVGLSCAHSCIPAECGSGGGSMGSGLSVCLSQLGVRLTQQPCGQCGTSM